MKKNNTKKVEFSCIALKAKSVFLAGTFNDWNPESIPLKFATNGKWSTRLDLAPGRYEFKFIVDGQWCCEPGCEHEYKGCKKCCANEMGTMNRFIEVS
ncbi:glycogen-binding domain-containing protein [Haloferula sp.]|uniref:glycogen-binding domain-containing protein n=1 Tax=Haloferula sp. TaxID=2497595 RepID=UPI003C71D425